MNSRLQGCCSVVVAAPAAWRLLLLQLMLLLLLTGAAASASDPDAEFEAAAGSDKVNDAADLTTLHAFVESLPRCERQGPEEMDGFMDCVVRMEESYQTCQNDRYDCACSSLQGILSQCYTSCGSASRQDDILANVGVQVQSMCQNLMLMRGVTVMNAHEADLPELGDTMILAASVNNSMDNMESENVPLSSAEVVTVLDTSNDVSYSTPDMAVESTIDQQTSDVSTESLELLNSPPDSETDNSLDCEDDSLVDGEPSQEDVIGGHIDIPSSSTPFDDDCDGEETDFGENTADPMQQLDDEPCEDEYVNESEVLMDDDGDNTLDNLKDLDMHDFDTVEYLAGSGVDDWRFPYDFKVSATPLMNTAKSTSTTRQRALHTSDDGRGDWRLPGMKQPRVQSPIYREQTNLKYQHPSPRVAPVPETVEDPTPAVVDEKPDVEVPDSNTEQVYQEPANPYMDDTDKLEEQPVRNVPRPRNRQQLQRPYTLKTDTPSFIPYEDTLDIPSNNHLEAILDAPVKIPDDTFEIPEIDYPKPDPLSEFDNFEYLDELQKERARSREELQIRQQRQEEMERLQKALQRERILNQLDELDRELGYPDGLRGDNMRYPDRFTQREPVGEARDRYYTRTTAPLNEVEHIETDYGKEDVEDIDDEDGKDIGEEDETNNDLVEDEELDGEEEDEDDESAPAESVSNDRVYWTPVRGREWFRNQLNRFSPEDAHFALFAMGLGDEVEPVFRALGAGSVPVDSLLKDVTPTVLSPQESKSVETLTVVLSTVIETPSYVTQASTVVTETVIQPSTVTKSIEVAPSRVEEAPRFTALNAVDTPMTANVVTQTVTMTSGADTTTTLLHSRSILSLVVTFACFTVGIFLLVL